MVELLRNHQLNVMLSLSSVCAAISFFAIMARTLPPKRKRALVYLEISACLLLTADRIAYIYRGDVSSLGFWMVRAANFAVFFLSLAVMHGFNLYLADLCRTEIGLKSVPGRLRLIELLLSVGWAMVIISQFTGFYYTFDATNRYQRGPGFMFSYIVPALVIVLQLSVIIQYYRRMSRLIRIALILFSIAPLVGTVLQFFAYGLSLTNITIVGMAVVLYLFVIVEMNRIVQRAQQLEIEYLKEEHKSMQQLFEQTATALANAIDAKDKYTQGHSARVAEYSREIARLAKKDEKTCDQIYYTALLHDVGKIGIPDSIINKESGLTDEEYEKIKNHPSIGGEILSTISGFPFLSVGARFHHERYDGKGYPDGLKGNDIPEIARIVAVADTYDAMTSKRSYRDPLPQSTVREEFVKGAGTQFDPEYAAIMVDMIDRDTDYQMKEKDEDVVRGDEADLTKVAEMNFGDYRSVVSDGISLSDEKLRIHFEAVPERGADEKFTLPVIILFDSLDSCVHREDWEVKTYHYLEHGEIWFDGHVICTAARDIKAEVSEQRGEVSVEGRTVSYDIEAVKFADHVRITIKSSVQTVDVIVALSEVSERAYIAVTGEHCSIRNISVEETGEKITENDIPRIAEEIKYTNRMEGDIPNLQVNHNRNLTTKGIPVADGMWLVFHTMSIPPANLIWNCAFILLFTSENGMPGGRNYREFACIRLDGENATEQNQTEKNAAENELEVRKNDEFVGWDAWKERNKKGFDCQVSFRRRKNKITMVTENAGIFIKNVTTVSDETQEVYVALTGERCALTNIRIL